jgi:3-phenylpropionate/trans-cinnamate dioxygenase ferredoxin component
MPTSIKIATLDQIPANGMHGFVHGERHIAIFRVGEEIYATDNICTHEEADLTDGWFEPDDCAVECPLHGARFDIRSGQALSLPAYLPVAVYPVRVEEGEVWVDLPG